MDQIESIGIEDVQVKSDHNIIKQCVFVHVDLDSNLISVFLH